MTALRDESGSVAVIAAAAFAVCVGIAAFAVDYSRAYVVKGRLQNAADAAALAAAQILAVDPANAGSKAAALAQQNSLAEDGVVTRIEDVVFGNYNVTNKVFTAGGAPSNAARVVASRRGANANALPMLFGRLMGVEEIDVVATAIAVYNPPDFCVFALDPNAAKSFYAGGGGAVRVPNCGIQVDSKNRQGMFASGASSITSKRNCIGGGYMGSNITPIPENCELLPDPLASIPEPAMPETCHMRDVTINTSQILPANKKYCGKIQISSTANVQLESGTYYFENASLAMSQQGSMEGDQVMLYFDKDSNFDMSSAGTVRLTAPRRGTYHGIVIFASRQGATTTDSKITGDRYVYIGGAIYAPRMNISMSGTSSLTTKIEAGYVIANTFSFLGSGEALFDVREGITPTGLTATATLVQ